MLIYEIAGIPTPWAAHQGYGNRSYNPRTTERECARWQIRAQNNRRTPIVGPVRAEIIFHMPLPTSTSKAKRLQMLSGKIHHIKRPDVDNLNKFICDVFKKIIIEDDSQIVEIFSRKIYSETPKTVIRLQPLNELLPHE